jgi:hypothetical protein
MAPVRGREADARRRRFEDQRLGSVMGTKRVSLDGVVDPFDGTVRVWASRRSMKISASIVVLLRSDVRTLDGRTAPKVQMDGADRGILRWAADAIAGGCRPRVSLLRCRPTHFAFSPL